MPAKMGPGAFSRLALMLLNPKDWIIVAPQVANPLIDCRPLRQAMRYGQVAQCNKTSVLLVGWLASPMKMGKVLNKRPIHTCPSIGSSWMMCAFYCRL